MCVWVHICWVTTSNTLCINVHVHTFLQHLNRYLRETKPELANNAPSTKEPTYFADGSTKVSLVLPTGTPGCQIIPDVDPPEVCIFCIASKLTQITLPPMYQSICPRKWVEIVSYVKSSHIVQLPVRNSKATVGPTAKY